jgi:hypothetical protein
VSLYVNPQVVALVPGGSANIGIIDTTGTLVTPTFTPGIAGQTIFALASEIGAANQTWTVTAAAGSYATFAVTVSNPNNTDTAYLGVTIAPAVTTLGGYTSLGLINQVRLRANEPNLPVNTDLLSLANACLGEVSRRVGPIRLVGTYPTTANQTIQALSADVQEIISCSWSTGAPSAQGFLVYPMDQLDQEQFMDFAAGFPAVGFGPPVKFWLYRDTNGTMEMQMYPAAMIGQLNVYYRGRPQPWTLTNTGTNLAASNIDPEMQEAIVVGTTSLVLKNRGRGGEAKEIWDPQYEALVESMKETAGKRVGPKSGQVRDMTGRGYPSSPWGWFR